MCPVGIRGRSVNDGCFFMPVSDFIKVFSYIYSAPIEREAGK